MQVSFKAGHTRIIIGFGVEYTDEERELLGIRASEPTGPKKTVVVDADPAHPWRVRRG